MAKKHQKPAVSVGFIALGCPKNIVDSEKMLADIAQTGFLIAADPSDADAVVINTCGFIEPARLEALDAVNQALKWKKQGNVQKIIVAGCLSQRWGDDLFEQAKGIDAIVGLDYRDQLPQIIEKTLAGKNPASYLTADSTTVSDDSSRLLITSNHWAYLRISEGCDRKCSFCTIGAIRGKFRSKPLEKIIAEANELANSGIVELNLIAQDSTRYGRDLGIKGGLVTLLKELEKIDPLKWIRLMYLYPADVSDDLIETIAASKKIVHYVDIPIQHINNQILKAMHRTDTNEKTTHLIERLRLSIPDVILRTTAIVGFPGETAEQFGELLDFIKWAEFDALGCFTFFPEANTLAAGIPGQIAENIKQARAEELMLTQQQIAFTKNKSLIGTKLTCLIDEIESEEPAIGRYFGQAPDVDSVCIIETCSAETGQMIRTKVTGSKDYDLIVKQING